MDKNLKILVADLDGTLLFRKKGVAYFKQEDIEAIKQFRKEGNLMVVNSGRSLSWLLPPLEGQIPWDYLIAGSGSCVMEKGGTIIYEQPLPLSSMTSILKGYPTDVEISFYSKNWVYTIQQTKEHSLPVKKLTDLGELEKETLYGMSFHFGTKEEAEKFADWLMGENRTDVEAFVNTKDVDIVSRGCSKGVAMQKLCQYLNVSEDHLYAIGDSYNDITMLNASKHPFTFHHVEEEMKQYATRYVNTVAEMIDVI